jgi:hypothetical protein
VLLGSSSYRSVFPLASVAQYKSPSASNRTGLVLTFGASRAQFSGQAPPSRKMCQRSGATPSKALA